MAGGEIVTKPIIFDGGNLALNFATSGAGGVRVELQEADGTPVEGYTLDDCPEIYGDHLRFVVRWRTRGGDLRELARRPVRLRFVLRDADLYSYQFVPWEPEPEYPDVTQFGAIPAKNPDREPFIVVQDDFEAYDAGTSPTDADLDPPGVGRYQTGWQVQEQTPDRVQVLCDDPPGSGDPGDNHYVKITQGGAAPAGGVLWAVLSPVDIADSTDGVVELRAFSSPRAMSSWWTLMHWTTSPRTDRPRLPSAHPAGRARDLLPRGAPRRGRPARDARRLARRRDPRRDGRRPSTYRGRPDGRGPALAEDGVKRTVGRLRAELEQHHALRR